MAEVYPRLGPAGVMLRLRELAAYDPGSVADAAVYEHRLETRPGSGGQRVPVRRLREFGDRAEQVAREHGFPTAISSKSDFDAALGRFLAVEWDMPRGEALHSGVWSFLTLCVVPHVAVWRFGIPLEIEALLTNRHRERLAGGNRNALQRTWVRAEKLVDETAEDPVWLIRSLPEDALVQVFERPYLSSDYRLVRVLAWTMVHHHREVGAGGSEKMHREAMKHLRAHAAVRLLAVLPDEELHRVIDGCWRAVRRTMGQGISGGKPVLPKGFLRKTKQERVGSAGLIPPVRDLPRAAEPSRVPGLQSADLLRAAPAPTISRRAAVVVYLGPTGTTGMVSVSERELWFHQAAGGFSPTMGDAVWLYDLKSEGDVPKREVRPRED